MDLLEVGNMHSHDNTAFEQRVRELEAKVAQLEAKSAKSEDQNKSKTSSVDADKAKDSSSVKEEKYPPWFVRFVINRAEPGGERKDTESEHDIKVPRLSRENSHGAAALLRVFANDTKDGNEVREGHGELEIFSEDLRDLLKKLLSKHPTHVFYGHVVKMRSPFEPIIHNWDLLTNEAKIESQSEKDQIARKSLGMILDRLQENTGDSRLNEYLSTRESMISSKIITFNTLWTIFPPGTIIYGRPYLMKHQVFIVKDNESPWPMQTERDSLKKDWTLKCWTYDWDGKIFQRRLINLTFSSFHGSKPVSALPYHPFSEADDKDKIKDILLKRGQLYRRYCIAEPGEQRLKYKGMAIVDKMGFEVVSKRKLIPSSLFMRLFFNINDDDDSDIRRLGKETMVESNIMVDFESYYQYGSEAGLIGDTHIGRSSEECSCTHCNNNKILAKLYHRNYDGGNGKETEEWEDLQYMLCPPRLLGYILDDKQWAQLDVDKIELVTDDGDAFSTRLHLRSDASLTGQETKELLMNLVTTHGQGQVTDLVEKKGKGLVILLYGKPGVGKTSTAQTIATAARKPLFSIGVADVGTKAESVESNLKRIFDLAARWKAILLIDEIDVFVQSRGMGHQGPTTERNALVSVFLRVLEYYEGILILTTNQIALFDVAVQSRIHIAIKYTELDKAQSIAIFKEFLDQYSAKGLVAEYKEIVTYLQSDIHKRGFDGRQLRNIVTSAMGRAQARKDSSKMKLEDITTIICNMDAFKGDLDYQMRRYHELQTGKPF